MHYSVTESSGYIEIVVENRSKKEISFWVRTIDDTAVAPTDYEKIEYQVTMKANETEKIIKIGIVDDEEWEPDKDFFVELCDDRLKRFDGDDVVTRVTVLDEDNPGQLGFEQKVMKVRKKDQFVYVRVERTEGAAGACSCILRSEVMELVNSAKDHLDFMPIEETLKFGHGETEKLVKLELIPTATIPEENKPEEEDTNDASEKPLVFQVRLDNPKPEGIKLSKKSTCVIEVVPNSEQLDAEQDAQQKMLEYLLQQKDATWG